MAILSVPAVASHLSVTPQRVRAMIRDGQLSAEKVGGQWLIDGASIPMATRRSGQPFSSRIAWGLALMVDGGSPEWLTTSERSRLRQRWRRMLADEDPVGILRSAMARRAVRSRWSAPEPEMLRDDQRFIASGKSDERSRIAAPGHAEGYVHGADFDEVIADHLLVPARGPENVIIRRTADPVPRPVPLLAIIADLADRDARETQQAALLLDRLKSDE